MAIIFAFIAGCAGTVKAPDQSTPLETNPDGNMKRCSIPPLVFNYSQKITKLDGELTVSEPGINSGSGPNVVPMGGVVYHSINYTSIFDSTGKQILLIDDTDMATYVFTPGGRGASPPSHVFSVPNGAYVHHEENNVTCIYSGGLNQIRLATIIDSR